MTKWITVKEAAEISGYHEVYLRQLLRAGEIEAQKFSTVWQVDKESLEAYLSEMESKGDKRGPKKSES